MEFPYQHGPFNDSMLFNVLTIIAWEVDPVPLSTFVVVVVVVLKQTNKRLKFFHISMSKAVNMKVKSLILQCLLQLA